MLFKTCRNSQLFNAQPKTHWDFYKDYKVRIQIGGLYASNDFHDAEKCRIDIDKVTVLRAPSVPNLACLLDSQWPTMAPIYTRKKSKPTRFSIARVISCGALIPRDCAETSSLLIYSPRSPIWNSNKNSKRSSANSEQSRRCWLMAWVDLLDSGPPIMAPRAPRAACQMNTRKKTCWILLDVPLHWRWA